MLFTLRALAVVMGFSVSIVIASECARRVGMRTDVQLDGWSWFVLFEEGGVTNQVTASWRMGC